MHGFLHGDCMTVTGRTIAENLKSVKWNPDQDVVRPAIQAAVADRRRRRPEGQSRARRRDRESRRHAEAEIHRPGALLRRRGGLLRGGEEQEIQGRRRSGHPLRGAARRPRHARDAVDHGRALRPGHGRQGRADHRRPLLRRDARLLRRPCRPGSGDRRPDRAAARRRHHRARCRQRHARMRSCPTTELAKRKARMEAARERVRLRLSVEIRPAGRPRRVTAR